MTRSQDADEWLEAELRTLRPLPPTAGLRGRTASALDARRKSFRVPYRSVAAVLLLAAGAAAVVSLRKPEEIPDPGPMAGVSAPGFAPGSGCECRVRFTTKGPGRPIPATPTAHPRPAFHRLDRFPGMALRSLNRPRYRLISGRVHTHRPVYGVLFS